MQNEIKREVIINSSKERIFAALTDPTQMISWFPDSIEGEISEGARPLFVFEGHGKSQTYIESVQPNDYFAYRWIPGGSDFVGDVLSVPNTLVEFRIIENEGICTVTLTETGFASLPADIAESSFTDNDGGWDYMIGRLEKLFKEQ